MAKYEANITMPEFYRWRVLNISMNEKICKDWSFSAIDGDPVMGQNKYCYLTAYNEELPVLFEAMTKASAVLQSRGVDVIRTKIERIVYDSKTGVDELSG